MTVADGAAWRLDKESQRLSAVRAGAAGLWDDAAARQVADRFLKPMAADVEAVVGHLREQEGLLEVSARHVDSARERGRLAAGHATRALDEIERALNDLELAHDYASLGSDSEQLAAQKETDCLALVRQAAEPCAQTESESGITEATTSA